MSGRFFWASDFLRGAEAGGAETKAGRRRVALRGGRRLRDRELARPGDLPEDGRPVVPSERHFVERDALLAGLLEVAGHDRSPQPLLGALVAAARPVDGQPRVEPGKADAQRQGHIRERDLGGKWNGEQDQRGHEKGRARGAQRAVRRGCDAFSHDPPDFHLVSKERTPAERQCQKPGDGEEEDAEPGALGTGVGEGPLQELSPACNHQNDGDSESRQPDGSVEAICQRRSETADPVARGSRLPATGQGEEVGVLRVVGHQRQRRQGAGQEQQNAKRLAGEPAAPERSFAQTPNIIGRIRRKRLLPGLVVGRAALALKRSL